MKRLYLQLITMCFVSTALWAQTDSTKTQPADTIKIGGMIIIKKDSPDQKRKQTTVTMGSRKQKHSNTSTANFIIDLGFANWNDKTNYPAATSQNYLINKPGTTSPLGANDFKLRTGKSTNVNIWVFMQRINLIKHYVNLKYGIGVELNNYRFKSNISFKEGGVNPYSTSQTINNAFVFRDSISFSKNKLAADYVTVPFMVNFRTNPNYSDKGISFSAGVSVGYLYNSRNKQISGERGKRKNKGDYDLEKWKFSYIGELGLGPVRLYGSYAPKSIFENGLNMMPYNIGIRLSNW
ncbi:MAG: outer membrane beta-barrel protein [Chitinophagaceae bacterium]|nr:outer membrane beta-barrel protein [Chitinophagaceae bacterium]